MKPILIKLTALLLLILCTLIFQPIQNNYQKIFQKDDLVCVTIQGKQHNIPINDYLLGVVAAEMPASFELEALKAQVLASRTFVYSRNLCVDNTVNTQVYFDDAQMKEHWGSNYDKYKAKVLQAIKETKGEIITYQGKCISALFYSSSNGKSENVENYFAGTPKPYLVSVNSVFDQQVDPLFIRKKEFTQQQLNQIFNTSFSYGNIQRYDSGRVKTICIGKKTYTGRQIRELLQLPSSDFDITKKGTIYTFTTRGSGHGVGMSQYGAQALALKGYDYKEIVEYYYQGIRISKNNKNE